MADRGNPLKRDVRRDGLLGYPGVAAILPGPDRRRGINRPPSERRRQFLGGDLPFAAQRFSKFRVFPVERIESLNGAGGLGRKRQIELQRPGETGLRLLKPRRHLA